MITLFLAVPFIAYWLFCAAFSIAYNGYDIIELSLPKKVWYILVYIITSLVIVPLMLGVYIAQAIIEEEKL